MTGGAVDFWEGVPALLYTTAADGRVLAASDAWCAAVGCERAAVVGRPEGDFLDAETRALADEIRETVLSAGRVDGVPYGVLGADGVVDVVVSAVAREGADGSRRIVAAWTDVTERLRIQAVLDGREADLRRLTRAASHDLQEPLRDVMGHLKRITDDYGDALDARGRRSLETAVLGGARMRRSVVALRTYSRLLSQPGGRGAVDLVGLVREAVRARAGASGVLFEGPGAGDARARATPGAVQVYLGALPVLLAERGQIALLVSELVDNAFVFAGDGPLRLHLDARRVGRRLRIALTDNGIGLDAALRGRALALFSRFEPARAPDGAGMGLALCRRVAENHDARLALAAGTSFGGGLRVVIDWPGERVSSRTPAS